MSDVVTLALSRGQAVALSNALRFAIRDQERGLNHDGLSDLYDVHEAILTALVGQDGAQALMLDQRGPQLPVPRNWEEMRELLEPICPWAWPAFLGCTRAATEELKVRKTSPVLFRMAAGVALSVRDEFDPNSFPPPALEDFVRAWAIPLQGVYVEPVFTDDEREAVMGPFDSKGESE